MVFIAVVFLVLSSWQLSMAVPPPQSNTYDLKLSALTKDVVAGTYAESVTGRGIYFITKIDGSLLVSTLEHRVIINVGVSVNDGTEYLRIIEVEGVTFLQQEDGNEEREYYLNHDRALSIKLESDNGEDKQEKDSLRDIDKEDETYHRSAVYDSILRLLNDSYLQILIDAVLVIGEREGLIGKDYPALLPLYTMAATLEAILLDPSLDQNDDFHQQHINQLQKRSSPCKTPEKCPPCEEINCLGLCGKKCSCWQWVCGDCCFNWECYQHDLDCKDSYFSFKCIFGAIIKLFKGCTGYMIEGSGSAECQ